MHTECASTAIARIGVTVTGFHEIGDKKGCTHADVELLDVSMGRVTQAGINATIVVHGMVYLDFFVGAAKGDRYSYSPVGISFRETPRNKSTKGGRGKAVALRDPLGHAAFPLHTIAVKGDTAQLTVFDANPEPADFKFDLIIQRSDGLTGIIDPGLKNRGIARFA